MGRSGREPAPPGSLTDAPYLEEVRRRVLERAPFGAILSLVLVIVIDAREIAYFPDRLGLLARFDSGFVVMMAVGFLLIHLRPEWSVGVMVVCVNLFGLSLNAYHALLGFSAEQCVLSLTMVLTLAVLIFQWGWRAQAAASLGALGGYPIVLWSGAAMELPWSYELMNAILAVTLIVLCAAFIERHARADFALATRLSQRETRLQSYFDVSLIGMGVASPQLRWIEVNDNLCRIVGYERDELLGGTWSDVVPADDLASVEARFGHLLAGDGDSFSIETRLVRKDGTTIDSALSARCLRTPRGHVDHFVTLVQDITERKRAEEAMRERQTLIEKLADAMPHVLYLFDVPNLRMIYQNKRLEMMFGYSREEIPQSGVELAKLVHPDDLAVVFQRLPEMRYALRNDGALDFECRAKHRSGEWRWLWCRQVVFARNAKGAPQQLIGTVEDITERKRAETALARFGFAVESTHDVIGITDNEGRVEYVNPAFEALTGYTAEELRAGNGLSIYAAGEATRTVIGEALQSSNHWSGEVDLRTKDGRLVPMLLRVATLNDASGRRIGAVGVATDMTEQRRAEEQLRQHRAELAHALRVSTIGEMAAGIAHELNQPLCAIASYASGCARRVRSGNTDGKALLEAVQQIADEALRGGEIIRRLKEFAAKREPRRDRVDVRSLLHEVVRLVESEVRDSAVKLALEVPGQLPDLWADKIQVEQVLVNLVKNALDAMLDTPPETRELAIRVSNPDHSIAIEIRDRGPGVPDHATRVFEPFFTTKHEGLGLGLSISRSIIEGHGGRLWASNNDEGGATFHVVLPIESEPT
jgi:two-component system sensor kinase FixL